MREVVAMKEFFTAHVPTFNNRTDLLTKVISRKKKHDLVICVLYDIYEYEQVSDGKYALLIGSELDKTCK